MYSDTHLNWAKSESHSSFSVSDTFFKIVNKNVFRDRKPPARPKSQPKVIRDSNEDFRINQDLDPDVAVSMLCMVLWIHYLVGVSHFAECRVN